MIKSMPNHQFQPQPHLASIPPRNPKYLRRALDMTLTKNPEKTLRKVNLKRLHIKKLADKPSYYPEELGKRYRICLKKKLFKTLTYAQIYSFNYLYGLEDLKNCKNLLKFSWSASEACSEKYLVNYFKRISSKNLEKVAFCQGLYDIFDSHSIKKVYKIVGSLPKLKGFHIIRDSNPQNRSNEEFQTLYRYLARLPHVQNLESEYKLCQGKSYRKVTRLRINRNSSKEFPFPKVFPNVRQLDIIGFGPFISQSFEKLPHLEALSLQINAILPRTDFLSEGFLRLPQLTAFSFKANFLTPDHWKILTQFMKNQQNLTHFTFEMPYSDAAQDSPFENFLQSLSHKSSLKYLSINYVSERVFPVISNGLKRITGTDKIRSFHCQLSEKRFSLPLEQSSLEGYCEFLMKNQKTLTSLLLSVPLSQQNDSFAAAISQLKEIKTLELMILVNETFASNEKVNGKEPLNLSFMLKGLQNLDSLTIDFPASPQHKSQVIQLFKVLPSLKSLRTFQLQLHELSFDVFSEDEVKMICAVLNQQKSLFFALLNPAPFDNIDNMRKISFALWSLYERHSLAVNLSF